MSSVELGPPTAMCAHEPADCILVLSSQPLVIIIVTFSTLYVTTFPLILTVCEMDVIFIIHVGTSKAGVDMLSKVMALELGQHKVEQLCCTAMIHTLS